MDREGFGFMLAEMDNLTLVKAEIMSNALGKVKSWDEYQSACNRLVQVTSPSDMDAVVAEVPLGAVRYEAMMGGRVVEQDQLVAINEVCVISPLAILHREDLTAEQFQSATFAWDTVLKFPWE